MNIIGTGSAMLTVRRDPGTFNFRIFDVANAATTPISVTINGLTLTGGQGSTGGAIRSVGENLSLDSVVVSGNVATGATDGGGIFFRGDNGSTLSVTHSSITGNTAGGLGGGLAIENAASVFLGDDTFSGNIATSGGSAISLFGTAAMLNVSSASVTIAGTNPIAGTGTLVKAGAGTLVLAGSNSYSGGTTLNAGTLDLAALQAAGTGTITFATGSQTLQIENAALSGSAFANTIVSFGADDAIDLRALAFAAGAAVTYNPISHILAVTSNGSTVTLTLTNPASTHFSVASDGAGGTKVLETTLPNPPPPAGTTADMILRGSNTSAAVMGLYEIYDIDNSSLLAAYQLGQVGTDWTFVTLGGFFGSDTTDMLLRNSSTGGFEVYDIDPPTGSTDTSSVGQLVQAMADFGGGTADDLDTISFATDSSQQPLLTTSQDG